MPVMSALQAFQELADILNLDDVQDLFDADPIIRDSEFHILKYHSKHVGLVDLLDLLPFTLSANALQRNTCFCDPMNAVIPDNSLVIEALTEGEEISANTAISEPLTILKRWLCGAVLPSMH